MTKSQTALRFAAVAAEDEDKPLQPKPAQTTMVSGGRAQGKTAAQEGWIEQAMLDGARVFQEAEAARYFNDTRPRTRDPGVEFSMDAYGRRYQLRLGFDVEMLYVLGPGRFTEEICRMVAYEIGCALRTGGSRGIR